MTALISLILIIQTARVERPEQAFQTEVTPFFPQALNDSIRNPGAVLRDITATHVMDALFSSGLCSTGKQRARGSCEASSAIQIPLFLHFYSAYINLPVRENSLAPGKKQACWHGLYLVSCARAADPQGQGGSIAHMRVVTL